MSEWLYPFERRVLWARRRRAAIVLLLMFLALLLLDRTLFFWAWIEDAGALEQKDFYRTFRVAGSLWSWAIICTAMAAHGVAWPRNPRLTGAAVMTLLSAALSGAAAELLQVLTGRYRPNVAYESQLGIHHFKGLWERFANPDSLAFPSSHAAVAFGAALLLWFVYPRAGAVALLAALGCGLTRMASGAHFATDIFGAALVGYAVARLLRPGGWRGTSPPRLLP
ncbi:MAG: phosphatase PAP2 family protein [Phycisphaerales bacterium]